MLCALLSVMGEEGRVGGGGGGGGSKGAPISAQKTLGGGGGRRWRVKRSLLEEPLLSNSQFPFHKA